MRDALLKLTRRLDLSTEETRAAFDAIMSGDVPDTQIAGLLVGLSAKGVTVDELAGAASAMREKSIKIDAAGLGPIIDTCGTGGDVRHTFNISTAAAFIVAGAGVRVVKHGNRSASSKSGSADVLEALGVKLDVAGDVLSRCLREANLCFAFARAHHPAMKHVAAIRQSLGVPTIFNMLGPLTNPGGAKRQLIGVFAPQLTELFAAVLQRLGSEVAWVVHAEDGLDELSTMGPTRLSELRDGAVTTRTIDAASLGLSRGKIEDLQVADATESAAALRAIFAGEHGPRRDIALLNAAAALLVAGAVGSLEAGLSVSARSIDEGVAAHALKEVVAFTNA